MLVQCGHVALPGSIPLLGAGFRSDPQATRQRVRARGGDRRLPFQWTMELVPANLWAPTIVAMKNAPACAAVPPCERLQPDAPHSSSRLLKKGFQVPETAPFGVRSYVESIICET